MAKIINNETDDFYTYRYEIHKMWFLFPGEDYEILPERVNTITIMDYYTENLYPIIKLDVALEESIINRLIKEKKKVRIKMDIRQFYRINSDREKSMQSEFINEEFLLILDDSDNLVKEDIHNTEYPEGDEEEMNSVTNILELFLFKAEIIKRNTQSLGGTFSGVSVATLIIWILYKSKIKNVLMPPPTNKNVYSEACLPSMSVAELLQYIAAYYGVYDTGTIFYFGLKKNYILPFCKFSNALEKNEPDTINIIVPSVGSEITDEICSLKRQGDTKTYVIADPDSFKPTEKSESATITKPSSVEIIQNRTSKITKEKSSNKKVVVQPSVNPYYKKIYDSIQKSENMVIQIALRHCDMSILTPNKRYQFIFEDTRLTKQYKGYYCLTKKTEVYTKDGAELQGAAELVFRRTVE